MAAADCDTLPKRPVGECLGPAGGNGAPPCVIITRSGDHTQSDRGAEDLKVVVVDLVLHPFLSDLVETMELIKIDGITVRHNQAVKNHGYPPLLTEAGRSNLLCFA
jgi:hypothetical protein